MVNALTIEIQFNGHSAAGQTKRTIQRVRFVRGLQIRPAKNYGSTVTATTTGAVATMSATLDQVIAKMIGQDTPLPSLELCSETIAQAAAGSGGSIIMVSSKGALHPRWHIIPYAAAKAGLNAMTVGFADAFGPTVRVNCIMPSIIDTPANRAAMPDAMHHHWPKPSQLAAVLAFLVSDEAILISGAAIPVYGRA